jgi:pimeloyl-ACP methyl ester carboxylesterase
LPSTINIVLVHGAWSDGSGWSKVIPILQTAGHNVVAVQNQMLGIKADSDNTRASIDAMQGPTVVAGHSYGGAVMTAAATGASNVKGLVYIAAFAPDEGESLGQIGAAYPATAGAAYIGPGPGGLLYIDRKHMASVFAGDLPPAEGAVLAATQRPVGGAIFEDKMGPPAWKQIASWYQVSEHDQMINPDTERMMAKRMNATTIALPSSHASLVAHPREVAELILKACEFTSQQRS